MATAEEQGILARYVGWGGLADAFDGEKTEWAQEYAQLKSLLDESEYMAARASTLTAFYTPPTVIRAMYSALERWGVTGGNILEPSMGVGAFFGCRPEQFDTNPTGLYGVELDHISARIAKQLYQSAHIYACGYEKTALPDSFFDCAVGNVPFGSFGVHDTRYDREHWLIHDYFFGKTIDKVRTGGIIAFITSSGTLDKASGNVRRYIAQRCELIGAVRLPSDTFRQSAGTEVTSDILFLQKRERMADRDEPWLHVGKTGDGVPINQYFVEHPEMVLGDMVMESGPFGPRSVCRPRPGQDLGAALHAALEGLDARLPAALPLEQAEQEVEVLPADPDVRNYSFTEVDGRLYFRENSVMRAVKLDGANTRRVRELIGLRSQTRRLMQVQLETDVTKLRLLKSSHVSQRYRLEDMLLLEYPQQLLERRQKIGAIEKDIPRRDANTPEDREQFSMTVMGREYTDKAAAGAELLALCQTVVQRGEAMEIGSYRGFAMRLEYRAMEQAFVVGLRGAAVYFAELGTDVQSNLARLNNALNWMEAHLKKLTQEISEIEKQQENTRQELEKPFAQEQELAEKEARLSAVNALLNIDGKNSIPDLMDDTLDIEPPWRAAKDYER